MNKKPGLAVLIALKAKKDEKSNNKNSDIGKELLDAVKADDAEKFGKLLKDYIQMCIDGQGAEEPSEEDET